MRRIGWFTAAGLLAAWCVAGAAAAEVLTADRAVEIALKQNTDVIGAEAGVLDARSGVYGAYSGVLPSLSGSVSRSGDWTKKSSGSQIFGNIVTPSDLRDNTQYSTSPTLSARWSFLNLSSLQSLSSARGGLKAAQLQRNSTRQEIAFSTRRQFYEVVKAARLAEVAIGALKLARDDERRVNALFEVGSVSKSDVLKARVRTAQSELDSLTAHQAVTTTRIVLAQLIGLRETEMGDVDTVLTADTRDYDRGALFGEAEKNRPDLAASKADLASAKASLRAANFARLPYLAATGSMTYQPKSSFKVTTFDTSGVPLPRPFVQSGRAESDLEYRATLSLNMDLFTGFQTESRIASARARQVRAQAAYEALRRNLESEVDQALLAYREAVEREKVSERAVESAAENVKLTKEKYAVGSSTILDLIDSQVQLERAQSDLVSALAAMRVAEAQIDRVRGSGK